MKTKVYKELNLKDLNEIEKMIKEGSVIAFPTETVYGLGCDIYNKEATDEIFKLKKRDRSKALIVHISNISQAEKIANLKDDFYILANHFFPGPLTLIVEKKDNVDILSNNNTIAIRMPNNNKTLSFIEKTGPIFGTSANISNNKSPIKIDEVLRDFNNKLSVIIDDGICKDKKPSTILDITKEPYRILRKGSVLKEDMESIIKKTINEVN
ncbi:MAG: Threonylcarbamoyl-AMP synthase [Candidatus Anoxychlamydiales bacterium]|nr:Threonylcarbamoyl-AMP synthase [Candidatus Anoxychlamydiales bacterium]